MFFPFRSIKADNIKHWNKIKDKMSQNAPLPLTTHGVCVGGGGGGFQTLTCTYFYWTRAWIMFF